MVKKFIHVWDVIIWILLIISGWFLYYTNMQRATMGYFTSGKWITLNSIAYTIFFALVIGYVIALLISKTKKLK